MNVQEGSRGHVGASSHPRHRRSESGRTRLDRGRLPAPWGGVQSRLGGLRGCAEPRQRAGEARCVLAKRMAALCHPVGSSREPGAGPGTPTPPASAGGERVAGDGAAGTPCPAGGTPWDPQVGCGRRLGRVQPSHPVMPPACSLTPNFTASLDPTIQAHGPPKPVLSVVTVRGDTFSRQSVAEQNRQGRCSKLPMKPAVLVAKALFFRLRFVLFN